MVELRWISFETTPPMVSMPSDSGVTSSSKLVLDVAGQNAGLHRRAQRDHFVGIQFGVRLGAEQRFHRVAHHGNARRAADHHHFIDLFDCHTGILDAVAARAERAIDNIGDQLLEQLARDLPPVFPAFVLEFQ